MQMTEAQRSEVRNQVRQQIRDARDQVRTAVQEAARGRAEITVQQPMPPVPPVPPTAPEPFGPQVIEVRTPTNDIPDLPQEYVDITIGFFVVMAVIIVGGPIARAIARRMDRSTNAPQQIPADTSAQLQRIEHAVEAMSLEVERISEGQRYLTKLQAERERVPIGRGDG